MAIFAADSVKKGGSTLMHLQRRQLMSIERRTPTPGSLTIYLGSGQIHSSPLNKSATLRQVLTRLGEKRGDSSMLERVPRDFEGNSLDLDTPLGELGVTEVVCLLESDTPASAATQSNDDSSPAALEGYLKKLSPILEQLPMKKSGGKDPVRFAAVFVVVLDSLTLCSYLRVKCCASSL